MSKLLLFLQSRNLNLHSNLPILLTLLAVISRRDLNFLPLPRRASLPRRESSQERKTKVMRARNNSRDKGDGQKSIVLSWPSESLTTAFARSCSDIISLTSLTYLIKAAIPLSLSFISPISRLQPLPQVAVGSANRDRIPSKIEKTYSFSFPARRIFLAIPFHHCRLKGNDRPSRTIGNRHSLYHRYPFTILRRLNVSTPFLRVSKDY